MSKFKGADHAAAELGLTLITPDRWGYGGSDTHPAPSLIHWARDMTMLADEIGANTFAVVGISGGGPFAAATAAALAQRVFALGLVSPVGPIVERPPDARLSPIHQICFRALPRVPSVISAGFLLFRWGLRVLPDKALRVVMCNAPAADLTVMKDADKRQRLIGMFREGLRHGTQGPVDDLKMFSRGWGFSPSEISAPAKLWIGTSDTNVPQSAAIALADSIPTCELVTLHDTGHLWIMEHERDVLSWIATRVHERQI